EQARDLPAERPLRRPDRPGPGRGPGAGARHRDALEELALVLHVALHRADQVRDQVVPPLELDVDLGPGGRDLVAEPHEPVVERAGAEGEARGDGEEHERHRAGRRPTGSGSPPPAPVWCSTRWPSWPPATIAASAACWILPLEVFGIVWARTSSTRAGRTPLRRRTARVIARAMPARSSAVGASPRTSATTCIRCVPVRSSSIPTAAE